MQERISRELKLEFEGQENLGEDRFFNAAVANEWAHLQLLSNGVDLDSLPFNGVKAIDDGDRMMTNVEAHELASDAASMIYTPLRNIRGIAINTLYSFDLVNKKTPKPGRW